MKAIVILKDDDGNPCEIAIDLTVNGFTNAQKLYSARSKLIDKEKKTKAATDEALKKAKQETVQQAAQQLQSQRDQTLKAATVAVDGATGETSKKIYRRADLIRLQMTDPERYMALQDDIMSAYSDGRVR